MILGCAMAHMDHPLCPPLCVAPYLDFCAHRYLVVEKKFVIDDK
jgi:hypothetical protein